MMPSVVLPFPPASLSGHNTGHWRLKNVTIAKHREWAKSLTLAAKWKVPAEGDIHFTVRFVPPDNRGDRLNFGNRAKCYFDGIADGLSVNGAKVNDRRFVPHYEYASPEQPGRVEVTLR